MMSIRLGLLLLAGAELVPALVAVAVAVVLLTPCLKCCLGITFLSLQLVVFQAPLPLVRY